MNTSGDKDAIAAYEMWVGEAESQALGQATPGLIECRDQIAEAAEDGLPDAIRELDKRLARVAGYVGEEIDGCAMVPQADSGWWVWLKAIARGEYPLDKLPEHVRDLAAELYYD